MDLAEHNRVKEALAKAEATAAEHAAKITAGAETAKAVAAKELAEVTERADKNAKQLEIAKKHINVFNPDKTTIPQWKENQNKMKARLTELEAKAAEWEKEKAELEAKLTAAAGRRRRRLLPPPLREEAEAAPAAWT